MTSEPVYPESHEPDKQTLDLIARFNLQGLEKELLASERILDVISEHFMQWLPRVAGPALLAIGSAAILLVRVSGVAFGVIGEPGISVGGPNTLLLGVLVVLIVSWFFVPTKRSIGRVSVFALTPRFFIGAIALLVVVWLLFGLYSDEIGGFVFSGSTATFDPLNIILFLVAVAATIVAIWIYVESENDHLILTTRRVILFDRQILGDYQKDQIMIEDVQDVRSQTDTYLQHWIGYGTVSVQSVRKILTFQGGERIREFAPRVQKEVNAVRSQQITRDFREVVDTKVYDKPVAAPASPKPQVQRLSKGPRILRWLVPPNPEIEDDGKVIWHPHWIFLFLTLWYPIVFVVVSFLLLALVSQVMRGQQLWDDLLTYLIGGVVILIFLAWSAYRVEDVRNEEYVLTPTSIIDVEKIPWGPEDRRTASIGAVQNVTTKTTLISRLLHHGDVIVETAGRGEFTFYHVPYPDEVVKMIQHYQDEFRKGDRKRSLEDMANLLRQYHEAQLEEGEINSGGNPSPASTRKLRS